jgi:hypothetical protein
MNLNNEEQIDASHQVAHNSLTSDAVGHEALVNAWATQFNLDRLAAGLAHISIPEQRTDHIAEFAKAVYLEGIQHGLRSALRAKAPPPPATLEGFADALLAPVVIARDQHGFFNHPSLPECDEDMRLDKLLGAFGLETRFVDLESDTLALDAKEKMSESFDFSGWTPTPPAGEGWKLLQIQETEDGAYAVFARRAAKLYSFYRRREPKSHADHIGGPA